MAAGFRRHLVGKTLKNAVIAFKLTIQFYANNSINLRLITPRIMF